MRVDDFLRLSSLSGTLVLILLVLFNCPQQWQLRLGVYLGLSLQFTRLEPRRKDSAHQSGFQKYDTFYSSSVFFKLLKR